MIDALLHAAPVLGSGVEFWRAVSCREAQASRAHFLGPLPFGRGMRASKSLAAGRW